MSGKLEYNLSSYVAADRCVLAKDCSTELAVRPQARDARLPKFAGTADGFFDHSWQPGNSGGLVRLRSLSAPKLVSHSQQQRHKLLYFRLNGQVRPIP